MSENSKIEWTDHTFNGWIGCTKVSPGCENCYAETMMDTRWGKVQWGKGKPRVRTSAANWKQPVKWNKLAELKRDADGDFINPNHRPRVFCASLSDWLDDEVPIEWLADLLALIQATPNLDWLLLTKRPENWKPRMKAVLGYIAAKIPPTAKPRSVTDGESDATNWVAAWMRNDGIDPIPHNVWIGTTVENQAMADKRIPLLLSIPATVRFCRASRCWSRLILDSSTRRSPTTRRIFRG